MAAQPAVIAMAKRKAGVGVAGTKADAGVSGTKADAGVAGTKAGAGVAGTKADAGVSGTKAGAGVAGTKADAGVAGTKAGAGVAGTKADAGVAGTKADAGADCVAGVGHPFGFSEAAVPFTPEQKPVDGQQGEDEAARVMPGMSRAAESDSSKLKVGPGGRVLIPADLRTALGVAEGDTLVATLNGNELRLMSLKAALAKAQSLVRGSIPAGVSLVDDLLAERRREVAEEARQDGGKAR